MNNEKYIPVDLTSAVNYLFDNLDQESTEKIEKAKNMHEFHFTTGMAIRNEWGLWSGGPLKDWFLAHGIWHADDMSSIIMDALHAKVHNKTFDFDRAKKGFEEYWEKQGCGFRGIKLEP